MSSTLETSILASPFGSVDFPERLPVGAVLNDTYKIKSFLSRGGFADVYVATKFDIDMDVAIKVLRPMGDDETQGEAEQRFVLDALAAARIRHPNIVSILACHNVLQLKMPSGSEATFDRLFFVMELLDGESLDKALKDGALDPARALHLFANCLEGLAEGHRQKIVHKDLKPENLFLAYPGARAESLKVLDFGTARVGYDVGVKLTKPGSAICTPEYTAPEYFSEGIVSPAIDVYQMGIILIEMLTGAPLVEGRPYECIKEHTRGITIPEALTRGSLGDFLRSATALNHEDRFTDAAQMCRALQGIDPSRVWPEAVETPAPDQEGPQVCAEDTAPLEESAPQVGRARRDFLMWSAIAALATLSAASLLALALSLSAGDGSTILAAGSGSSGGDSMEEAEEAVKAGDMPRALEMFSAACQAGVPQACLKSGWMRFEGKGGAPNDESAVADFRRSCIGEVGEGCTALGMMYSEGRGLKRSKYAAMEFYAVGCDAKDGWGCHLIGQYYESKTLMKKAHKFYERGCGHGLPAACTDLGRVYEANRGFLKRDPRRAAGLHSQACQDGESRGCTNLGRMHEKGLVDRVEDTMTALYTKGCAGDDNRACLWLGALSEKGEIVPLDTTEALRLYQTACERDSAAGCRRHKALTRHLDKESQAEK